MKRGEKLGQGQNLDAVICVFCALLSELKFYPDNFSWI